LEPTTKNRNQDVIVYLDQDGKNGIFKKSDIVKKLLDKGYRICAVDLRGLGETSPDMANLFFWDFLAGKPLFGQRVYDVLTIIKWLKKPEINAQNIKIWGTGICALYGAFAGTLCSNISRYVFEEPLLSFESIVKVKVPGYKGEILIPDILKNFDLPQVYQALCPSPVTVINPLWGDKTKATEYNIELACKPVQTTYKEMKKQDCWSVQKVGNDKKDRLTFQVLTDK
jgi:hypothetical protein